MSHITLDDPSSIAAINLHDPRDFDLMLVQIEARVRFVKAWGIQPGERVLEIGCGQAECTSTLAAAVGEHGSVTALDPASPTYGSPYTLGETQAHLRASPLGARMKFIQMDPLKFLSRTSRRYATAVFSESVWYFASPRTFTAILEKLALRVDRVCVAEWALRATHPRAMPHVLAALASAALQCHRPVPESNIRTVLSPAALRGAAASAGLAVGKEEVIVPVEGMVDGRWETRAVLAKRFANQVEIYVRDERERAAIYAMRDSVQAALDIAEARGKKVRAMDIWIATFVPA